MTIDFMPERQPENRPRITVFGVGGAGGNAVNNMIAGELEGVDFVVANTDAQSLFQSLCENRVRLGVNITQGLGAGARADIGKVAAEEALDDIQNFLQGNNMVFIAAGMGGGTGTGAAPVIARAAREHGILTVGVVTKPFHFEGSQRMRIAERGIQELHQYVDTLIVIPNQNLFRVASDETTFADAFGMADDVLHAGVRGVTDLMVNPGLINLDFADIRTVMGTMGKAMMGTGEAEGESRATEAAEAAINNPLLDNASIEGARGVLINVTGGTDVTLHEVDKAASRICEQVDDEATIIFGTSLDQKMDGYMRVAVIATGIDSDEVRAPIPDSDDNIHVLGFADRKGASGGGSTMSAQEPRNRSSRTGCGTVLRRDRNRPFGYRHSRGRGGRRIGCSRRRQRGPARACRHQRATACGLSAGQGPCIARAPGQAGAQGSGGHRIRCRRRQGDRGDCRGEGRAACGAAHASRGQGAREEGHPADRASGGGAAHDRTSEGRAPGHRAADPLEPPCGKRRCATGRQALALRADDRYGPRQAERCRRGRTIRPYGGMCACIGGGEAGQSAKERSGGPAPFRRAVAHRKGAGRRYWHVKAGNPDAISCANDNADGGGRYARGNAIDTGTEACPGPRRSGAHGGGPFAGALPRRVLALEPGARRHGGSARHPGVSPPAGQLSPARD